MDLKNCKRGDVLLVDLEPQIYKNEADKIRPCVVVQDSEINGEIGTLVVIPFSTVIVPNAEPLQINFKSLKFLDKNSDLVITQIRVVSDDRAHKKIGALSSSEMQKVDRCIKEVLGLR